MTKNERKDIGEKYLKKRKEQQAQRLESVREIIKRP